MALQRPSVALSGGQVLSLADRFWLDAIVERASAALGSRVLATVGKTSPTGRFDGRFGVSFELMGGISPCRGMVALDMPSARAVADSILVASSGLQAFEGLTASDEGLLEFASLLIAGTLSSELGLGGGFQITSFLTSVAEITASMRELGTPTSIEVWCLGRQTEARVALERWGMPLSRVDPLPPVRRLTESRVLLSVGLPAIKLSVPEYQSARPGDVMMLGIQSISQGLSDCAIVTGTGWRLSDAIITHDTPTMVAVRRGAFKARPMREWVTTPGSAAPIHPLLGQSSVGSLEISSWDEVNSMSIAKGNDSPVTLWRQGVMVGRGALVRVDDELGVAITSWSGGGDPMAAGG